MYSVIDYLPLNYVLATGNGLFLFGMGRRKTGMNFLGLEMNAKVFVS